MSDFRCPRYWWDGSQWRCQNLPNDYLSSYDFDTYCTNKNRCLECPYMDSEVRERVASWKKENEVRREELEQEQRKYEENVTDHSTTYERTTTTRTTTYSSSGGSDTGCLGTLFSLIGFLIMGLFKLLFYFYKYMFLYFFIPFYSSVTVYGLASVILFGIALGLEFFMLPLAILEMVVFFISIPYWVILFTQKRKRQMKWKETFKYYGKWFVKGPWAYKDIIELKNKPMSF